ncbi:hypothetical protein ACFIOY_32045 [Bradyrhizobium sp. TZ2]
MAITPRRLLFPTAPVKIGNACMWSDDGPLTGRRLIGDDSAFLILVRVHSDEIRSPLDWIQVQNLFGPNANLQGQVAGQLPDGPPTQVILVEWIQMIITLCKERSDPTVRPRIGILITAWDLLSEDEQAGGPSGYLKSQYRLLSDYLRSNGDRAEFATFGVSLFGGDLKMQPEFRDQFLNVGNPRERGFVDYSENGESKRSSDLTLPVMWALGAT